MTWSQHFRETYALSLPIIVMRAGFVLLVTIDTMSVGRYAPEQLAYFGLGVTPQVVLMVAGFGLMQGTSILTAQAVGADERHKIGAIFRGGLTLGFITGLIFSLSSIFAADVFRLAGQSEELIAKAVPITHLFAPGLLALMIFVAITNTLDALGRPRIAMWLTLVIVIANLGLDYLFVFGSGDLIPAMGAEGAVMTSTGLRIFICIASFIGLLIVARDAGIDLWAPRPADMPSPIRPMIRIGTPMFLIQGLDVGAFRTIAFMAATLGPIYLATYEITNNLIALAFMMAIGSGAATSIRVGRFVGAGDTQGARRAGWSGIISLWILVAPFVVACLLFPKALAGIYVDETEVIDLAVITIQAAGIAIIFDASMGVVRGALRGAGDVWPASIMQAIGLWVIAVPFGWYLTFKTDLGVEGLVLGLAAGLALSVTGSLIRFGKVSSRPIERL